MRAMALAGVLVLAGLHAARGADPAPVVGMTTAGQLDVLNAQIAVLEHQLQIAKLRAQIATAGDTPAGGAGAAGRQVGPNIVERGPPGMAIGSAGGDPPVPEVLSISGAGTRLSAVLVLPGGGDVVATPGLKLPDGLTVGRISAAGVEVGRGGTLVPLPFATGGSVGGTAGARGGPSEAVGGPRLPPPLPGLVPVQR